MASCCTVLPLFENKERRHYDKEKSHCVVPLDVLLQVPDRKPGKDHQSNDFLNCLELCGIKDMTANAVGRDLKGVFKECDSPANECDFPQWHVLVLKMAIPGKGHKDVGNEKTNNCQHEGFL